MFVTLSGIGGGTYVTLNNGSVISSSLTTAMTLPNNVFVGTTCCDAPDALAAANLEFLTPVTFSTLTLPLTSGPFILTISAGNLIFSFTQEYASILGTTPTSAGSFDAVFYGTVSGDNGIPQYFLGQDVIFGEACTQVPEGTGVSCSQTLQSMSNAPVPNSVPEPMSIALLGSALLASGASYCRRKPWKA
jgi:hypothetical protein